MRRILHFFKFFIYNCLRLQITDIKSAQEVIRYEETSKSIDYWINKIKKKEPTPRSCLQNKTSSQFSLPKTLNILTHMSKPDMTFSLWCNRLTEYNFERLGYCRISLFYRVFNT